VCVIYIVEQYVQVLSSCLPQTLFT